MAAKTSYHRNFSFSAPKRVLLCLGRPYILALTLVLASSYLLAADPVGSNPGSDRTSKVAVSGSIPAQARYRVYALKHISSEQAKKLLVEANLGTVSQLPAANMLLVTAQPRQLIKASAILKLMDTETPVVMKAILPASAAVNLPSNEQIAAEVGDILIGSFSNPPSGVGKAKAIIDVHDDAVMAIAPADRLEEIVEAIKGSTSDAGNTQIQKSEAEALQLARPETLLEPVQKKGPKVSHLAKAELERVNTELQKVKTELNHRNGTSEVRQEGTEASDPESNGLFGRLLDSLNDAEKKAAKVAQPALNGPGPDANVAAPDKAKPKESVELRQAKEIAVEANQPPAKPDVAAVSEKPEDKKKAEEQPQKPDVAAISEKPEDKKKVTEPPEKPDIAAVSEKPEDEKKAAELPKKPSVTIIPEKPVTKPGAAKIVSKKIQPKPAPKQVETKKPDKEALIVSEKPTEATRVVEPNTAFQTYQPEFTTSSDETLELELPPKLNIIDLLDLVGKYLNLNYMYDPADVTGLKGEVSLTLQGPIKIKDLYPLAESVLRFKGFVMTRKVDLVTIVPLTKVLQIDPPIVDPKKRDIQAGNVVITRIFELKHIDPASAKNLLDGMKLGADINTSISELNKIIVTGYAYRMARIEQLIDMVDKPGEERKFRSRALRFTMAKTLATKVKALAEQLGTVSIAIGAPTSTTPIRPTTPIRRTVPPSRPPTPTTPAAAPTKESVYLDADERTNRILMIGLEEQLAVVDTLIDALDVEQQDLRTLRLYEIQHVDAEEVVTKLSELGIISGGRSATGRATTRMDTRTTIPRPTPGRLPTTGLTTSTAAGTIEEPLVEEPQVVIIEPTNSLLVNATAEQHVQISIIIGYVDAEQEVGQNPYVIYPLENQDPEELAGVLEKLISETITEKSGTGADAKVVRTTTKKNIEEDITIVSDPKSYSLIIYASKKNQQWIASLIKELDAYRPQVLLDVTLVEITKNENFDLDIDLEIFSGLPKLGFTSLTGASIKDSSVTAFYQDKEIDTLLTALHKKGYGRVLARPKLLVNDNEEGTIKTETQTTIVSPKTQVVPGSAASVSTAAVSVDMQTYTSGITLTITPHIHQGDHLQLIVNINRVDFDDKEDYKITIPSSGAGQEAQKLEGPTPPDLLTSDVTSTVTVPDNSTIILGGLERLKQTKGGTKIPFLGDIPLIGGLFRTTSNEDGQSRLYVFVKANIIRPGEEGASGANIQAVSLKNRRTFEKYEREMQEYEDWPGIKPKPMDPERILEEEEEGETISPEEWLKL